MSKYFDIVNTRSSIKEGKITSVMIPYTSKMLFIMTIISMVISLIIGGIAFGVQYAVDASGAEFLFTWLYSFIGWVTFLFLALNLAKCVGKSRFRNLKTYLETNKYEGGQIENL